MVLPLIFNDGFAIMVNCWTIAIITDGVSVSVAVANNRCVCGCSVVASCSSEDSEQYVPDFQNQTSE